MANSFHAIDAAGNLPKLLIEIDVTNAPTNPVRVWTDVTLDVRSINYSVAGRNDELQRTGPGRLTMQLSNATAKYDYTYVSGVGIKRSQWVRVQAQWAGVSYPRWQGIIETIALGWPAFGKDATATVTAGDASKVLNLFDLVGLTFSAQATDQRVATVCTAAGVPYALDDAGASTLVAVSPAFSTGSMALGHLQEAEATENGLIFADGTGTVRFQSRHYRLLNAATSLGTIGDQFGEIPYRDAEVLSDDGYLMNSVAVTTTNADGSAGATATKVSATSETNNFTRQYNRSILSSSTIEAQACAEFLVSRYADPQPRVSPVELIGAAATAKWPLILGAKNSQRFTFVRRATHTISEDVFVEQVSDTIIPGTSWSVTVQPSPAADQSGWLLGNATYGLLGQTTVVTY